MTLCIRLFANITAGHLIILSLICVIFIFKSIFAAGFVIPFASAGVWCLVSALQAFIFPALSSLFIGMAIKDNQYETS